MGAILSLSMLGLTSVSQAAPTTPTRSTGSAGSAAPTGAPSTRVSGPLAAKAGGFAIDTSNKAAVAKAYRTRLKPNLSVPSGWTGKIRGCKAGTTSRRAQQATMESLNFARGMNGLGRVAWSAALSKKAQHAALIMAANKKLSHFPAKSWKCWTQAGYDAAGKSNLALGYPKLTAGGAVMQYLDDWGSPNLPVGHRRWILYPFATSFGNAMTSTSNTMYVFGATDPAAANPAWVSWPTKGWFPSQAEPMGRWSFSSGSETADFRSAKITVTHRGKPVKLKKHAVHDGYGMPTVVWEMSKLAQVGKYVVKITGIKHAAASTVTYPVLLFKP